MAIDTIKSSAVLDGAIATADIADDAVTSAKINYPLTTFSSTGIDDNADALAMTIDSSERVLVGTTSATIIGSGGIALKGADGRIDASGGGGPAALLDRRTNDGDVVSFSKAGSAVGKIGTFGSRLHIASNGNSGLRFRDDLSCIIPCNADGSNSDADQNLGQSGVRFQTLFLSGGVRLGGTGTANELDDYEEGTWTPTLRGESGTEPAQTSATARYVKVGQLVHIEARVAMGADNGGSGMEMIGLPFASQNAVMFHMAETAQYGVIGVFFSNGSVAAGSGIVTFREGNGSSAWQSGTYVQRANGQYTVIGTYTTAS